MAFLFNKSLRRATLILILLWSVVSFWSFSEILALNVIITIIALYGLFAILKDVAELFLLIFLSFTAAYALYGFLFLFNLPIWLIMLANLIIFIYLFAYYDQKKNFFKNERSIFLILFGLISSEVFLVLSYLLVSPINRSAIIMMVSYILAGFCIEVLVSKNIKKFWQYIYVAAAGFILLLSTSIWS